jgi:hypothetical protein
VGAEEVAEPCASPFGLPQYYQLLGREEDNDDPLDLDPHLGSPVDQLIDGPVLTGVRNP